MTDTELLQRALAELDNVDTYHYFEKELVSLIETREDIRKRLAEPWVKTYSGGKPNYTEPIEKEWVGLTDDEADLLIVNAGFTREDLLRLGYFIAELTVDVEDKLKEKNSTTEKNIQTSDNND